jgi:hypothetical protein
MYQHNDIYSLITSESENYKLPVPMVDGWDFCMYDHIKKTVIYKYGQLLSGKDDNKATANIILPILRLRYRTEGFDVKNITLFVDSAKNYWKSLLVKKFHERFAAKYKLDKFIDDGSETDIDFGGVLIKDIGKVCPEVVPWQRVAFCDQTNVLSGPICEKHSYSPDELQESSKKGWQNIDEVIVLAQTEKPVLGLNQKAKTPGKYIEVYEVHGVFPRYWLYDEDGGGKYYDEESSDMEFIRQLHIVTFYQSKEGDKKGITLYKGKEKESPYKFRADEIYNRALGLGGVEELIDSQVWSNFGLIHIKEMLQAASKVILKTTDSTIAARHPSGLRNLKNLEVIELEEGKDISQIDTSPKTVALFDDFIDRMKFHAREMGAATESLMGEPPKAGTPFALQELVTNTSMGLHEHRMGKFAAFIEEVYREWILPHIVGEINQGVEFLSELDLDELQEVADALVKNEANKLIKEKILNGETIDPAEIDSYKQKVRDDFMKGGNKKWIELFKNEFKDAPISVRVDVAGKQKNLAQFTDKLVNVFRQVIANPTVLQIPAMAKLFNSILENSGLNPMDFSGITKEQIALTQPQTTSQSQSMQPQPVPMGQTTI